MKVIEYPRNLNCFKNKNIKDWITKNNIDYVIEIHKDSIDNKAANGSSILLNKNTDATIPLELLEILKKYFYQHSSGLINRDDLYNMNQVATMKNCEYCLIEVCFNSNENDNKIFDSHLKNIENDIYNFLETCGIINLGVIYGHGQGDHGACNGTRYEDNEVRRFNFKERSDNVFEVNGIKVVNEKQYQKDSIKKAIEKNIVVGDGKKLDVSNSITKGDLCVILDNLKLLERG